MTTSNVHYPHQFGTLAFTSAECKQQFLRSLNIEGEMAIPVADSLMHLTMHRPGYVICGWGTKQTRYPNTTMDVKYTHQFHFTMTEGRVHGAFVNGGTIESPRWGSHT